MAESKRLPIKIVEHSNKDFSRPDRPQGGGRTVFDEITPAIRRKYSQQLRDVAEHFQDTLTAQSSVPAVAKVILKKKALAKSHRPLNLFSQHTCPIIGVRNFCELLISVTLAGLENLDNKIINGNSKTTIADISTIEEMLPFTYSDALGSKNLNQLKEELSSKNNELRVRLFTHNNEMESATIIKTFLALIKKLNLPEPEYLPYSDDIKLFKLTKVQPSQVKEIAKFIGTQNISTFPYFNLVPASTPIGKANPKEFPGPSPKSNYPVIGIVDTGINPTDPILMPWVLKRHDYVAKNEADYGHGSFVAGLAVHARLLNSDSRFPNYPVRFIDVAAMPKNGIPEYELRTILEEVVSKHPDVRYWNLSMNTQSVNDDTFSPLAIALDELQDKYNVTFVISAGNFTSPLRGWPPEKHIGEADRIQSPAESVRAVSVGSLAHLHRPGAKVQSEEPSPFSRRGPGAAYIPKPELVHYGGNCQGNLDYTQIGIRSLDNNGQIAEGIGTSFSTPLITSILANIRASIKEDVSPCLVRALAVHSAALCNGPINAKELRYRGFGIPGELTSVLTCSPMEITLIFEPELRPGFHFNKTPFPFPPCLLKDGKAFGEITMTLAYDPPLDPNAGAEYCQVNVDASLGTCELSSNNKPIDHCSQIPAQPKTADLKTLYEEHQVTHGFKWSPLKVYRRSFSRGVSGSAWNLRLSLLTRATYSLTSTQKVSLIVTIRDPEGKKPVYDEAINLMRNIGWNTLDLQVQERIRLQP